MDASESPEGEGGARVEITVRLWGNIAYHSPEAKGRFSLKRTVDEGATVQKLVDDLKLPKELPYTIVVNGVAIESEYILKQDDRVDLFAPFSGG